MWHSRFSVSLLWKYNNNNHKWQRAKKKLTRGPPQIDLLNKKTQPNKQTKTKKKITWQVRSFRCFKGRGRARTQVPTTRNYTLELPTFGVIAGVNPIEVQWEDLAPGGPP